MNVYVLNESEQHLDFYIKTTTLFVNVNPLNIFNEISGHLLAVCFRLKHDLLLTPSVFVPNYTRSTALSQLKIKKLDIKKHSVSTFLWF